MDDGIYLSIIIPAYNEEAVIEKTLTKLTKFFTTQDYKWEVIVVDDASTDSTVEKIKQAMAHQPNIRLLANERNMRKGGAVKRGILDARGKYTVFMDADYTYPVNQVSNFLYALESGADIVTGNRVDPDSTFLVRPAFFPIIYQRYLVSRTFNRLVRLLLVRGISDTQCGIKGFRTDTARAIFEKMTVSNFAFDVEILYIAQQNSAKIVQIPVTYDYIAEPSSIQLFRDAFRMFNSLLRIKSNGLMKRYTLPSKSNVQ